MALALVGTSGVVMAQSRVFHIEEPQLFKMNISEVSAGVYSEGSFENTTYKNSGNSATHDWLFAGPSLGLNLDGSIYHPNLFRYQIISEGAYGWSQDELTSGGSTTRQNQFQYIGRFSGAADILANKPFHASLFGDYDHTYRDYDFFSRVIVDTWRYGLRSSYNTGPFTFTATFTHRDEDVASSTAPSTWHQDVAGFSAHHERQFGGTTLTYTYDQYDRNDFGVNTTGVDHTVALSDNETFGSGDHIRLNSAASYTVRESDVEPSDETTAGANLTIDHRDNLTSLYDVNFDRYSAGAFNSDNLVGQGALRHKLYDSLVSTLTIRGVDYESSDDISTGYNRRFGLGLGEGYVKHVGLHHRIRMDGSILAEHVDQQNISTVKNERHTFGEAGAPPDSFFLNMLNVDQSTIQIWNVSRTALFVEGIQYNVLQNGSLIQIQRILGAIPPIDNTVVVDYQALPTPEGHYESFTDTFGIRFEFWNNIWGVYGRFSGSQNNAPKELSVQNIAIYTAGTDFNWHWLRAGGEYSIYRSDQSSYNSARLFQGASMNLDQDSSISIEFSQTWTDYIDAHRNESDYRFVTRYRRRWTSHLHMDVEGGFDYRQGQDVDQTLATFRPGIDYVIGRTSIKAGYDFEYNLFLNNETRVRHMFFIRAKRIF
jgi:hypothetical protein